MRFTAKMHQGSRQMVELWRAGQIFAVVHFSFFRDKRVDPESTLIKKLAEGKHVNIEMHVIETIVPALDGVTKITGVPQTGPSKNRES